MCELKFCRICLDHKARLFKILGSEVQDVYEKITKIMVQEQSYNHACYICYHQLQKCQELVRKSQKSEELLKRVSPRLISELDPESISLVERVTNGLVNILTLSDMVSLQIPECQSIINIENQIENDVYEETKGEVNEGEHQNEKLPDTCFRQDEQESREEGTESSISEPQTNTASNENIMPHVICNETSQELVIKSEKECFMCNECGKTYYSKALLIKHIGVHKPMIIKLNEIVIKRKKQKVSRSKLTLKEKHGHPLKKDFYVYKICEMGFKCQTCNFISRDRIRFKKHIRTHTAPKTYKCQHCNFSCIHKNYLEEHVRTHTSEKLFKCNFCNYTCRQKNILDRHIRIHTGEKPYKCQYCNYACTLTSSLKRHIRIHTGEKPFKCLYCDYTCTLNDYLKKHIMTHTGEKPFKCKLCNYMCTQKNNLKKHIRTHTGEKPFKCDFCNYTCSETGSLKKHIKIHTGEKSYKCRSCNYACSVLGSLKRHIRTHTGEKPYKCHYCDYICTQSHILKKHMKTHNGNVSGMPT